MDNVEYAALLNYVNSVTPLGDWTAKPALAATTVPVTNNSGHKMNVEITGGTVTAVKVDGVTIGARVSGSFPVRNGSTIAWVGSVAPTSWQWFYAGV